MKKIPCFFIKTTIRILSISSFRMIYFFSDLLYYFFYYVIPYRKDVVRENLTRSFPEKSLKEIKLIEKSFYRHLADLFPESLKAFSMSNKAMINRYRILNPEILDKYFDEGRSVIAVAGHFNNWEWGSVAASSQLQHKPVGIYKPLSNECVNEYIRKNRERNGTVVVPIQNTADHFIKYLQAPSIFMMLADQNPSHIDLAHWGLFLNRKTAFLHGPEKYSRKHNLPVVYVDIQKIKRGFYTVTLELLTDKPDMIPDGGITALFIKRLEKAIISNPENWLWSHKRWKHSA